MFAEDAGDIVEKLDAIAAVDHWAAEVWERCRNRCSNCGSDEKLHCVLVVPEVAGGQRIASNAVILCRVCDVARQVYEKSGEVASGKDARPINFWISRTLHTGIHNGLGHKYGFKSVSALVRFLMRRYVQNSSLFDDVLQYQDHGNDVKVSVWVPRDAYAEFKDLADANGGTVTDTIKGLIRMYELEAERVIEKGLGNEC